MFDKKFVRVESMALARALELQKEVGLDCYLGLSWLVEESGVANRMANVEEIMGSGTENFLKLPPKAFDLVGEIEEFAGLGDYYDDEAYLTRDYAFNFNHPKTNKLALHIRIVLAKKTSTSDWAYGLEVAHKVNERGCCDTPVINREHHAAAPAV